ncbi:MAG: Mur ligase family protein [Woeseiaceae bacterium]|nr:Mur ligase family protein [Woeseiaceae bacterium]
MEFLDARRLTGPSLLFDDPAAILDVACTPREADAIEPRWRDAVSRMCQALRWSQPAFARKDLAGGVSLAFTAPIDALYAASEINEWAWQQVREELDGGDAPDFDSAIDKIAAEFDDERHPALLELQRAAARHQVTFLWDDDEVSLGLGKHASTWPARELPDIEAVNWTEFADVPIGIVTGTNGKTTTVRLAQHILAGGGNNVGMSSTDWIGVNDRIIDRGDWSGPGGARKILRQTDVDVAILECARGGLLRRGLGVQHADAALITNIAEDHLGDFGSQTIDELLDIKWIVSRAVRDHGRLILNADDRRLVDKARDYPGQLVWTTLDERNDTFRQHLSAGGLGFVAVDGELQKVDGSNTELICRAADIPITLNGAARHNVANALAAAALTWCLGATLAQIADGLRSMSQDRNPGRCNVYDIGGKKVLVDFAHNPHAMQALFDMAEAIPAKRRVLCFGQAGDRPDRLIRDMTRDAWAIGLDRVIVSELADYHRGREYGEVYGVIRDELGSLGAKPDQIDHFDTEPETFESALAWANPGDLVIMLALGNATAIRDKLSELQA